MVRFFPQVRNSRFYFSFVNKSAASFHVNGTSTFSFSSTSNYSNFMSSFRSSSTKPKSCSLMEGGGAADSGAGAGGSNNNAKRVKMSSPEVAGEIVKSALDKREYRGITLNNKLKVLLISDPLTDKSAASLSVATGSMCDPAELPGLAHFCEHMLFMGTEKYPVENDYSKFLTDHGGDSNAYTDRDHTNYYFNVSPTALEGALDRFSQFFISPLFSESATEREVNAVNSEHENNIPEDDSRSYQVGLVTSDATHPFSRFPTGNRQTLWTTPREKGVDVRAALLEFHRKHYSANVEHLAVLGKEGLDELQEIVERLFNPVENKGLEIPHWPRSPYTPKQLGRSVQVLPVKDVRWLMITFPIDDPAPFYKSKPGECVSQLIGHEGAGSLLSLLKEKRLVNSLSAGPETPGRGFGLFEVSMDLTQSGLEETDSIIRHLFQYLEMLRAQGVPKWVWEEKRDIEALLFRFKDKERPQSYVEHLSPALIKYPMEDVLSAYFLAVEYREDHIKQFLSRLTPRNAQVQVVSRSFAERCDTVEKFYGVKYSVDPIPQHVIERWENCGLNDRLRLPPKNEFIPSEFDLKPREENRNGTPEMISDRPLSQVWFLQDDEFLLPKAVVHLELFSLLPLSSMRNAGHNYMFVAMICDLLTEEAYAAGLADLTYGLDNYVDGVSISVDGYNHKLEVLLGKVLGKLLSFDELEMGRFELIKELYARDVKNWHDNQPSEHAEDYLHWLLHEKGFLTPDLTDVINDITVESLKAYAKEFLSQSKMRWLFYGNLTKEEAVKIAECWEEKLVQRGTKPVELTRLRDYKLPKGSDFVYCKETKNHSSSCTAVILQCGVEERRRDVTLDLLVHMASEPCFDQLRTKEQLGYVVYACTRRIAGSQALQITIQGERHPVYVEGRIDSFLKCLGTRLAGMSAEEFETHKSGLRVRKSEKPKTISHRAALLWVQIKTQTYDFHKREKELETLQEITLTELQAFFKEVVEKEGRRRLTIRVISMAEDGAGRKPAEEIENIGVEVGDSGKENGISKKEIKDVERWRGNLELYPIPIIEN